MIIGNPKAKEAKAVQATCPYCHGNAPLELSSGQLIIGEHQDDRGRDCEGWGKPAPTTGLSEETSSFNQSNDSGNLGGGLSDW